MQPDEEQDVAEEPRSDEEQEAEAAEIPDERVEPVEEPPEHADEGASDIAETTEPAPEQEPAAAPKQAQEDGSPQPKKKDASRPGRLRTWWRRFDFRLALFSLLPDKYTDYIEQQARYARIGGYRNATSTIITGFVLISWIVIGLLQLPLWQTAATALLAVPTALVLPYAIFVILAERRKREIEQVLPDALLLMSANIESGLTVEKAFLLSARDEFGPLGDDIRRTAMKMFGGKPVDEALNELAESTNSELFAETLKLLIDGINAGGTASRLLESSAEDIRNSLHLREEIEANVKMYSIFILFASMLGAPLLFAVSTYLAETSAELWGGQADALQDLPQTGVLEFHAPDFNVEFFRVFAIASLIISNTFAALIMSEIKNGNVKNGLKYIPVFTVVAVVIYLIVDVLIAGAFGGAL